MTPIRLLTATAISALIAAPAFAQDTMPPADPNPPVPADSTVPMDDAANMPATEPAPIPVSSPSATASGTDVAANVTVRTITNGPVADTAENRAKYGQPMSRAGKRTAPKGN